MSKGRFKIVPVAEMPDRCGYCLIAAQSIKDQLNRTRGVFELRASGVKVEIKLELGEIPPATHNLYDTDRGAMSCNATPICTGHATIIQGIQDLGSLDAFINHLKQKSEQLNVIKQIEEARDRELGKESNGQ